MKINDLKIKIDIDEDLQKLLKEIAADLREIKDLLKEIKGHDPKELWEKILDLCNGKNSQTTSEEKLSKLQIKSSEVHDKLKKHFIPEDH